MTIRVKLYLMAAALVMLTVLLMGGLQYFLTRRDLQGMQEAHRAELAQSARRSAETAMRFSRPVSLAGPAETLTRSGEVKYVWLLDHAGQVLFSQPGGSAGPETLDQPLRKSIKAFASRAAPDSVWKASNAQAIQYAYPIPGRAGAGEAGAVLVVGFDRKAALKDYAARLGAWKTRTLWVAFVSLVAGLLGAGWMGRSFTRTLGKLESSAQRIGEGHLSARILTGRVDELGHLSDTFNTMSRKLEELEELKKSFLVNITHDLRNPLSCILGYCTMLQRVDAPALDEKSARWVAIISNSAKHLAELIDNILDLTKMEAGHMEHHPKAIALKELVTAVSAQLQVKADEFGVRLDLSGIPEGRQLLVDEQAFRRLLTNLGANALKFTPKGGAVSFRWEPTEEGLDRIIVQDTGIGIPKDKIDRLFEKFFQVEETHNVIRPSRGTGLGLVICKEIVEAHGGVIGVKSEYQKGTAFFFTLPPVRA